MITNRKLLQFSIGDQVEIKKLNYA